MRKILLLAAAILPAIYVQAQTKKVQITTGIAAQIKHTPGAAMVQVLIPGVEMIELDLSQPLSESYQIKTADYNFDGYKDFAFVAVNQATGMQPYDIYLYRPEEKSFEVLEVPAGICERFSNVRINAADKSLRSSCKAGVKSSLDTYVWTAPFQLELRGSVDHSMEAQQDAAEEKADEKAEKDEQRANVREERADKKAERKETKDDED